MVATIKAQLFSNVSLEYDSISSRAAKAPFAGRMWLADRLLPIPGLDQCSINVQHALISCYKVMHLILFISC